MGLRGWWQYDERTSLDLEAAYKRGERSCELLIAGYLYVADFDGMVQLRRRDPSRRRRIKRDLASIPVKGVAGLRQRTPAPVEEEEESQDDLTCYFPQDGSDERGSVSRTGRFRNQSHLIQIPPTPANTPGNTSPGVPQTPGATSVPMIIGNAYPEASLRHVVEEMGRLRLGETRACIRHGTDDSEERSREEEDEVTDEEVVLNARTSSVLWSPVSPDIASTSPWVLTLSSDEDQLVYLQLQDTSVELLHPLFLRIIASVH
ncbi:hypothetical protein J437_LFUL012888 [Ladona fulva]|uniref:E3 ubiquitin-protein ligase n=1 Tax=Ladona fulva TaxID=123851 RepID=A0A8K0KDW5_LADFU|nr:hypothetical protein J437_LFUL012888 [Ladona fulva]